MAKKTIQAWGVVVDGEWNKVFPDNQKEAFVDYAFYKQKRDAEKAARFIRYIGGPQARVVRVTLPAPEGV